MLTIAKNKENGNEGRHINMIQVVLSIRISLILCSHPLFITRSSGSKSSMRFSNPYPM